MVTTSHSGLLLAQQSIYQSVGTVLRVRIFSGTIVGGAGSYYDDQITWTLSSTTYTSGLVMPVGTRGTDAFLKEQGRILDSDLKFVLLGTVSTSGMAAVIGIGSPPPATPREYHIIEVGPVAHGIGDSVGETTSAYKVVYGRYLQGGSLLPSI